MYIRKKRSYGWLVLGLTLIFGFWYLNHVYRSHSPIPNEPPKSPGAFPETQNQLPYSLKNNCDPPITHALVSPIIVSLDSLTPVTYDPNTRYERRKRQKFEEEKNEDALDGDTLDQLEAESRALRPNSHLKKQQNLKTAQVPEPSFGFDSLDVTQCCVTGDTGPPDPELAAGSNHLIAVVNMAFEIYDKSGNSVHGPTTFHTLFSAAPHCSGIVFDPNVIYDEEADRFILGIVQRNPEEDESYYCMAVSASSDPTGFWYLYEFPANLSNPNHYLDFPHAGVGRDAIYMGGNMFVSGISRESRAWAFDKTAMYAGQPAGAVEHCLGPPIHPWTPQPLNLHGYQQGTWPTSGPHYFFALEDRVQSDKYELIAWDDPFGANTLTRTTIDLNAVTGLIGHPLNAPQLGDGSIETNDWSPLDFEYRNGYGWITQNAGINPGSGTVTGFRWAQIDLANSTVVQAGLFADEDNYRYFPDLAVNANGDMMVGYSKSSDSLYPGIWYTGRLFGDPLGTLRQERQLKPGEVTYDDSNTGALAHRWGDYTGMTIDPDGFTFWYLGEYSKDLNTQTKWGTYIHALQFGDCSPTAAPPVAEDDFYCTREDTSVDIFFADLLANDFDANCDELEIISQTLPANGVWCGISPVGLCYVPNPGFRGIDAFTYTISDGNGGTDTATVHIEVLEPPLFADTFDSGHLNQWNNVVTLGSGTADACNLAAFSGNGGLCVYVDTPGDVGYVVDQSPNGETSYRARFYFNAQELVMNTGALHTIFLGRTAANTQAFKIFLKKFADGFRIRGRVYRNDGSSLSTAWMPISDPWNLIELHWLASAGPFGKEGKLELWVNEGTSQVISVPDNDQHLLEKVHLGAMSGIDAGTKGVHRFDEFESRRLTYIGPLK